MNEIERMGGVIRRLRMEKAWTQEELAERLGVSGQAVSKWETGQSLPDISQVPQLARVFGVSTDELFGMEEEPAPDFPPLDYRSTDPEEAWQNWQEMGAKLESGPASDAYSYLYLYQGFLLCCPDSLVYHPQRAPEVLETLLPFAEKLAERSSRADQPAGFSLLSVITNLNALAGNEEKALAMLRDAPVWPQELGSVRRSEVYRFLGKRKEEKDALAGSFCLLRPFLLFVLHRMAENALALGRGEDALYIVDFGLGFLRLLCETEKVDALYANDGYSFMQLGARALLALGRREEALVWLQQMADEKLATLEPGHSLVVDTPLFRGVTFSPGRGDEAGLRYHRALLLRALDHPDLAPLREEPEVQALRECAEALGAQG